MEGSLEIVQEVAQLFPRPVASRGRWAVLLEELTHTRDVRVLGEAAEERPLPVRDDGRLNDHPAAQHEDELHHGVGHAAGLEGQQDGRGESRVAVRRRRVRRRERFIHGRDGLDPVVERRDGVVRRAAHCEVLGREAQHGVGEEWVLYWAEICC